MENFELEAEVRTDLGKGASRRLRRTNKIPAVIYGGGKDPVSLTLDHDNVMHHLENEAFYSHVLTIKIGNETESAVLRDVQRHPARNAILHIDLMRVDMKEKLHMNVPLHFINEEEAFGVKQEGGVISHLVNEVEVACLPGNLPEYIEVDVRDLKLGESIHLSQLQLPEGVELVQLAHGDDHDLAVVSIHKTRGSAAASEEGEGGETAEGGEAGAEGGE